MTTMRCVSDSYASEGYSLQASTIITYIHSWLGSCWHSCYFSEHEKRTVHKRILSTVRYKISLKVDKEIDNVDCLKPDLTCYRFLVQPSSFLNVEPIELVIEVIWCHLNSLLCAQASQRRTSHVHIEEGRRIA